MFKKHAEIQCSADGSEKSNNKTCCILEQLGVPATSLLCIDSRNEYWRNDFILGKEFHAKWRNLIAQENRQKE